LSISERPVEILRESQLEGVRFLRRGKVRDLYDLGDRLLLVATDRLSAFDVVFPGGIPEKGRVLTQLSLFWFRRLDVANHILSADVSALPASCAPFADQLEGRIAVVEKLDILPIECVVRGYLAGSGWVEYRENGTICGLRLPAGLVESSQIPEPIFTPSTKATSGHDENISFAEVESKVGAERAAELRDRSLEVYRTASEYARSRGIILADTKFEWGVRADSGELVLADEVLTPDSSRFWAVDAYSPGKPQTAFDKQYVRDYLLSTSWNKQPPAPRLPDEVVEETAARYRDIYERLTGTKWPPEMSS
jgi:phosphoribosylaminoimidazole-succinocarboxamide synthase